jgi:hypothetical protein
MIIRTALAILVATLPVSAFAESMRCGKWVINEESSPAEIIEKCGEPQQREITENDVLARNAAGNTYRTGTRIVERWTYQRSPGALPMQVTVVDGKVTEIRRIQK